jgi:GR25 family glycosyltransferase involved in LPS biosynthesis
MISFNDFQCYLTHYTKNESRKRFMQNIFQAENITDVYWIEKYDREELSYIDVYKQFKMNINEWQTRQHNHFSPIFYPLKPEEVSLCLKHKEGMRHFLQESSKPYMFIMEDDAMLAEGFKDVFDSHVKSLPGDWDVAFIGSGGGKRIPKSDLVEGTHWYKKAYPGDRCTDSILFTKQAVKQLYDNINDHRIAYPIDHELSFWMRNLKMNVYWLEPPIVTQGSQCGIFDTFQDEMSGKFVDMNLPVRKDLKNILG